jgi:membrane-bound lytic murein transglycosylase B
MTIKNKKQLKIFNKKAITNVLWVVALLFSINIIKPIIILATESTPPETEEEKAKAAAEAEKARQEAEDKVKDTKKQLKKLDKKKKKTEKIKANYTQEANVIKGSINNLAGNINIIEKKVQKTESELERIENSIKKYEEEIILNKKSLAKIVRKINQQKLELQLSVLDDKKGIDDYMYNRGSLNDLQKKVLVKLNDLKEKKRELNKKQKEASEAQEVLTDQKKTLEKEKVKKSWLYNGTQKKISEKDAEIREIENEMAALNSTISRLLGKSYNTNDIKKAAGFASKATGVRKAFILGMLTVETNLGRYTGGCNYKSSRMNSYRKKVFKQIAKETGHNYKKMKVSCPPARYKGTGGAMGVAQFMSDTWMGYKAKVAAKTGHNPPDPWNLTDGVMAMAIKLANDGATKKSGECRAAMRYLGGSHHWYCDKVLRYAKQYEK